MDKEERLAWGRKVDEQLRRAGLINPQERWFFTGKEYSKYFAGHKVFDDMRDFRNGKRLKWFADHLKKKERGGFGL